MEYSEEEYLQLSGLQHFKFCRRQWALIHIENQWAENYRTTDGILMHERAHDPSLEETRGDRVITRGMPVFSRTLGISGQCDVLEFHRDAGGVPLCGQDGLWQPFPVEYKRGKPNEQSGDELQLCGQAICLEELLCCTFLKAWQNKKQETITHPYLKEQISWGLVPYVQALLLARYLREDLDGYPPLLWK